MADLKRLTLDANIMVSALLGKSLPLLVALVDEDVDLLAAEPQIAETRKVLERRPQATEDWVEAQMLLLLSIVEPLPLALLVQREASARLRLGPRGQSDWPLIAACDEVGGAIWSHDKDLFGSGAPVWSTRVLRRQFTQSDE